MKPRLFIGSSREGRPIAGAIQSNLTRVLECTIWDRGVFGLGRMVIPDLQAQMKTSDFAVLVFSADDVAEMRADRHPVVRDNVLFELGMAVGHLGAERSFFLVPDNVPDLHLPSDLSGITRGSYEGTRTDGLWQSATDPFCVEVAANVARLGFLHGPRQRRLDDLAVQYACCEWIVVDPPDPAPPGTKRWERKAAVFRKMVDVCTTVPMNKRELADRRFEPFAEPSLNHVASKIALIAAVEATPAAPDIDLLTNFELSTLPDGNARICALNAASAVSDMHALSRMQFEKATRWMAEANSAEHYVQEAQSRLRGSLRRHQGGGI